MEKDRETFSSYFGGAAIGRQTSTPRLIADGSTQVYFRGDLSGAKSPGCLGGTQKKKSIPLEADREEHSGFEHRLH